MISDSQDLKDIKSSVQSSVQTDFSSLSREELIVRLEHSSKELFNNGRGTKVTKSRFDNCRRDRATAIAGKSGT
jgi:hypothetical protein